MEDEKTPKELHVNGKWCADLHCSKCYSADTWQNSRITEQNKELTASSVDGARYRQARRMGLLDLLDECEIDAALNQQAGKGVGG